MPLQLLYEASKLFPHLLRNCHRAVSYTHLDVYKRQYQDRGHGFSIPQKSFIKPLKRHRHNTTITCRYFITIVTGFQQNIALKQSRCLTVAQPAAKRSIRADLPFARQSKKKCGIFYELGMRNGNKPTDGLLWYPRRAVFDTSHQKRPCALRRGKRGARRGLGTLPMAYRPHDRNRSVSRSCQWPVSYTHLRGQQHRRGEGADSAHQGGRRELCVRGSHGLPGRLRQRRRPADRLSLIHISETNRAR